MSTTAATPPPVRLIAEIGCNHRGEIDTALEMIAVAATIGRVDVAKFHKRCPREPLSPVDYAAPHPAPHNAHGDSYGAHRERLELTLAQHRALQEACAVHGGRSRGRPRPRRGSRLTGPRWPLRKGRVLSPVGRTGCCG